MLKQIFSQRCVHQKLTIKISFTSSRPNFYLSDYQIFSPIFSFLVLTCQWDGTPQLTLVSNVLAPRTCGRLSEPPNLPKFKIKIP